jgi:hypothetical protein
MDRKERKVASEKWADVSQRSASVYLVEFFVFYAVLLVAGAGVTERQAWCQLQGYTILIVSTLALFLYVRHQANLVEETVESVRAHYCVECCKESRSALIIGRLTKEIPSNYERLFPSHPRFYFALFIWLAWIAYGAVFHEGQHALAEEALIDSLFSKQNLHSHSLRSLRMLLLFAISIAICVMPQQKTVIIYSSATFFLLMFFPDENSSAQTLGSLQMAARTGVFICLFLLAELADRAREYRLWIDRYNSVCETHLICLQMALGVAHPLPLLKECTTDHIITPIADPSIHGARFSFVSMLSRWSVVVKTAWVLVVSDLFVLLASVQLVLLLMQFAHERRMTFASAGRTESKIRRKGTKSPRSSPKALEAAVPTNISLPNRNNAQMKVIEKVARDFQTLVPQPAAVQAPAQQPRSRQAIGNSLRI